MNHMAFYSRRRALISTLLAALMALSLTGCLGGISSDSSTDTNSKDKEGPPTFEKGTAMKTIQDRGKIYIGVVPGQAPFSSINNNQGTWVGFDVETGKMIARSIFGDNIEGKIEWIPLQPADREDAIIGKRVDIALGRYVVTQGRKNLVDFAGPYYIATQDIVVRENPRLDNRATTTTAIEALYDLNGRRVCTVTGSTNVDALAAAVPRADRSLIMPSVPECMSRLSAESVEAVAAMHVDLIPSLKTAGSRVAVFAGSYGAEPYGIGVMKGDTKFRSFLNDSLTEWEEWDATYRTATGDQQGKKPEVDRY